MASPFAVGTASAAAQTVSTITVNPATYTVASGAAATANVTGSYTATSGTTAPTNIEFAVTGATNAGDESADGGLTGTDCAATISATDPTAGTFSCPVPNASHSPSTDTVRVFADNGNDTLDPSPTDVLGSPVATVIFTGPPTSVAFTSAPTTGTTGTCAVYTAHTDAGDQPLDLTVNETTTAAAPANSLTYFANDCSGAQTSGGAASTAGGTTTLTHTVTTDASGNVSFGLATTAAGSGTVALTVPSSPATGATTNVTWATGGSGSVTTITPSPTSVTQLTNTTASFTVTASNASGPVQGVQIMEESDPAASSVDTVAPTACGTTDSAGTTTCTVHNGGTAGNDSLIFYVNTNCGTTHTNGADACEPQAKATATFNATPAVDSGHSSVTCVQQLAGDDKGTAQTDCTVPTSQTSVVFTATVEDASGNPIPNAPVTFTATSAKLGGATVSGSSLPSGTVNTGTNGVATFTVNDPTPAAGDNVSVSGAVGAVSIHSATAHWAAPAASGLSLTPPLQTVTEGGVVTVKATVTDQFGTPVAGSPNITYFVTGRNNAKTGTATSDGTITYTDAGSTPTAKTDTIAVTDTTDGFTGDATVVYVTGATTASTVTVDTSGLGVSDATCAATANTAATGVAFNHATEVCAVVKNANGEALAGKAVTFTVSNGQVAAHGGLTTTSGTTYQATTDIAGVAFADVTSTKTGAQTVTATADSATGNGTVTYAGPTAAQAYKVTVDPATTTIAPGSTQKFVATVVDKFGNPVPGVVVVYTQSGAGSISGGSGGTTITGSDGTASVSVATQASTTGTGSVTFNIGSAVTVPPNQCATTGGICSAVASYTVAETGATKVTVTAETGAKVGTHVSLHAVATNADGTPAANQLVRFYVKGANNVQGSATTGPLGHATFSYLAAHHGKDTVGVFVDINNDQIREANEPTGGTTAYVKGIEKPTISLVSHAKNRHHGTVTIHVVSHPVAADATVHYFVKRGGTWHKIGTNRTGHLGKAGKTFTEAKGAHLTFRAKVMTTKVSTTGTSSAKSITVK